MRWWDERCPTLQPGHGEGCPASCHPEECKAMGLPAGCPCPLPRCHVAAQPGLCAQEEEREGPAAEFLVVRGR